MNAFRISPPGGRLRIELQQLSTAAAITITDDGPGIPLEHLPRLTERFYRVDASMSRETGGTGLGLAIVKHIVEAHRQTIGVMSTEGVGSVFTFTLQKS